MEKSDTLWHNIHVEICTEGDTTDTNPNIHRCGVTGKAFVAPFKRPRPASSFAIVKEGHSDRTIPTPGTRLSGRLYQQHTPTDCWLGLPPPPSSLPSVPWSQIFAASRPFFNPFNPMDRKRLEIARKNMTFFLWKMRRNPPRPFGVGREGQ